MQENNGSKYLVKSPAIEQSDQVVEIAFGGVQSTLDRQDVLLQFRKGCEEGTQKSWLTTFPLSSF